MAKLKRVREAGRRLELLQQASGLASAVSVQERRTTDSPIGKERMRILLPSITTTAPFCKSSAIISMFASRIRAWLFGFRLTSPLRRMIEGLSETLKKFHRPTADGSVLSLTASAAYMSACLISADSKSGYASRISGSVMPSAIIPTMVATGILLSLIQGTPPF